MPSSEILRQAALFAVRNRDGWGIGATILTALGNRSFNSNPTRGKQDALPLFVYRLIRFPPLRLGRQRFNKVPSRQQKTQLKGTTDLARLQRICDRLLQASSWTDLLDTP